MSESLCYYQVRQVITNPSIIIFFKNNKHLKLQAVEDVIEAKPDHIYFYKYNLSYIILKIKTILNELQSLDFLRELSLDSCSSNLNKLILKDLSNFRFFEKINFYGILTTDELTRKYIFEYILSVANENCPLKSLTLIDEYINSKICPIIYLLIKRNIHIEDITIKYLEYSFKGIIQLIDVLVFNSKVNYKLHFLLQNKYLETGNLIGLKHICFLNVQNNILILDFEGCGLTDNCFNRLSKSIKNVYQIKQLFLIDNENSSLGALKIIKSLKLSLEELSIDIYKDCNQKNTLNYLATFICNSKKIKSLFMDVGYNLANSNEINLSKRNFLNLYNIFNAIKVNSSLKIVNFKVGRSFLLQINKYREYSRSLMMKDGNLFKMNLNVFAKSIEIATDLMKVVSRFYLNPSKQGCKNYFNSKFYAITFKNMCLGWKKDKSMFFDLEHLLKELESENE